MRRRPRWKPVIGGQVDRILHPVDGGRGAPTAPQHRGIDSRASLGNPLTASLPSHRRYCESRKLRPKSHGVLLVLRSPTELPFLPDRQQHKGWGTGLEYADREHPLPRLLQSLQEWGQAPKDHEQASVRRAQEVYLLLLQETSRKQPLLHDRGWQDGRRSGLEHPDWTHPLPRVLQAVPSAGDPGEASAGKVWNKVHARSGSEIQREPLPTTKSLPQDQGRRCGEAQVQSLRLLSRQHSD